MCIGVNIVAYKNVKCGDFRTRRNFSKIKNINNKLALAYDFQILDNIKSEIHDIKVDYIISNNETIITY